MIFSVLNVMLIVLSAMSGVLLLPTLFFFFCGLAPSKKYPKADKLNKYGIIICARNESMVIDKTIDSVKKQNYPQDLIDVYVVADNCTDNTAQISKDCGAYVFERFNDVEIGKGYALDYCLKSLIDSGKIHDYKGFFIFDADSLLDKNYVIEMNNVVESGYSLAMGQRTGKNPEQNMIAFSGSMLYFIFAQWYLRGRVKRNITTNIGGTGFYVATEIYQKYNGSPFYMLTEDIQFTCQMSLDEVPCGCCEEAVFYDEQPTSIFQSMNQRLRWHRGMYDVSKKYAARMIKKGIKQRSYRHMDYALTLLPLHSYTLILSTLIIAAQLVLSYFIAPHMFAGYVTMLVAYVAVVLGVALLASAFNVIRNWKSINTSAVRKVLGVFCFVLYLLTYALIIYAAPFASRSWKPIKRVSPKNIDELGVKQKKSGTVKVKKPQKSKANITAK